MINLIIKYLRYSLIIFCLVSIGILDMDIESILILAAVLTGVNTFIRPIFILIALPLNIITD